MLGLKIPSRIFRLHPAELLFKFSVLLYIGDRTTSATHEQMNMKHRRNDTEKFGTGSKGAGIA
jgi:hypothetical protein